MIFKMQESKGIPAFLVFMGELFRKMNEYTGEYSVGNDLDHQNVYSYSGLPVNDKFRQEIRKGKPVEKSVESVNNNLHIWSNNGIYMICKEWKA